MMEKITGIGGAQYTGPVSGTGSVPGTAPVPGSVPPQGQPQPGYGPPQQGYPGVPPGYPQPGHSQPGHPQPGYLQGYGPAPPGYQLGQPGLVGVQPGAVSAPWMAKPETVPGCPPGLEYLTQVDQLLVQQFVELIEVVTHCKTPNRYYIKNTLGQQVYYVFEESDVPQECCDGARGFTMHVIDNTNQEVMRVSREYKCCVGCCWCANNNHCGLEVVVEAPVGQVIGYVRQRRSFWKPSCDVLNAERQTVLTIRGPCCITEGNCCTEDQEFKVFSTNGIDEIGKVSKQWSARERYASDFGLEFTMDLDAKVKATLVGALFLIEFMFFEQRKNRRR
ncbi:phospholipid scramblase 1-like isoform X2 [Antedon mediterranea]|uniref:phospholipid scramblase 1-like isoform X2 n=1 Tax=Antedon mediterranea TaxID=105859 RepID=UPI003AF5479D